MPKKQDSTFEIAALGLAGFDEVTSNESGDWLMLVPVGGNAEFSATTESWSDDLSQAVYAEGVPIYGPFTDISHVSGTILAYKSK